MLVKVILILLNSPKHKGSDSDNLALSKRSQKVPPLNEKVQVLNKAFYHLVS